MSATTGHQLLNVVKEYRGSVRFYWGMERRYPDRASYYRAKRKTAFIQGLRLLQWAREELRTEGHSPRSYLREAAE